MISEKRLNEIMLFLAAHGEPATLVNYKLTKESLRRYKNKFRFDQQGIPKVLLLDIETAPMEVYTWNLYKPRLNHGNIIEKDFILAWAAKWLFSSEYSHDILTPKEARKGDDTRILKPIWKLMNDSDVIIAHNALKFDIKWLNTEFFLAGMKPPMPYQTIDTLVEFRKRFRLPSNRLDYIGKLIRRKGKIETDFKLWKKCKRGDEEALGQMMDYNLEDVYLLEDVYVELRPWIRSHPNMGIYKNADRPVCPNCGSDDLFWENKYYTTMSGKYAAFRCANCGAPSRCRYTALNRDQRKNLLASTAR